MRFIDIILIYTELKFMYFFYKIDLDTNLYKMVKMEVKFMYMLGNFVDISVKGLAYGNSSTTKNCVPLFYGYVTNPGSALYRKKVYIITNNNLQTKKVKGQIIASNEFGSPSFSKNNLAVAAPLGHVFYLPEIKKRLSRAKAKGFFNVSCLYEKSCGAIIFKENNNGTKLFLIIKHKKNKRWGFPKGHTEINETDEQTAKREVKEETSLDIEILKGFKQIGFYRPYGNVEKKVVLFLARAVNESNVKVQKKEIDTYKWATAEEVFNNLSTKNDFLVFKSALNWLYRLGHKF